MRKAIVGSAVFVAALGLVTLGVLQAGEQKGHGDKAEAQAKVGEPAPQFKLHTASGEKVKLADLTKEEKVVVLEWFNPECPYVKKHYADMTTMNDLASKYAEKDVVWLRVNSSHHHDAEANAKWAEKWSIDRPILVDQDGKVGKMYGAKTTPHMYIIDAEGKLAYAGAIDSNRSHKPAKEGEEVVNYVDEALKALLAGEEVSTKQTKPYGCSVKYGKQARGASGAEPIMVASADGKKGDCSGAGACAK